MPPEAENFKLKVLLLQKKTVRRKSGTKQKRAIRIYSQKTHSAELTLKNIVFFKFSA